MCNGHWNVPPSGEGAICPTEFDWRSADSTDHESAGARNFRGRCTRFIPVQWPRRWSPDGPGEAAMRRFPLPRAHVGSVRAAGGKARAGPPPRTIDRDVAMFKQGIAELQLEIFNLTAKLNGLLRESEPQEVPDHTFTNPRGEVPLRK